MLVRTEASGEVIAKISCSRKKKSFLGNDKKVLPLLGRSCLWLLLSYLHMYISFTDLTKFHKNLLFYRAFFCGRVGNIWHTKTTWYFFKGALTGLRQFWAIATPLKMMKNAFYFTSKALFVLTIFKFLSWLFGHVTKQLD